MVTLWAEKTNIAIILVAAAVTLYVFLSVLGLSLTVIALIFIVLSALTYLLYICSDRMILTWAGASRENVPASLTKTARRYCEERHIRTPPIAVVDKYIPDLYVIGASKRKSVILVTSGALGLLSEDELEKTLTCELTAIEHYQAFDLAIISLVLVPFSRLHERSLSSRYMRNGIKLPARLDEHLLLRKATEADFIGIYRQGVNAFCGTTGFIPLHRLAYLYDKPTAISIIAESDGVPVGFILGHVKQGADGINGHVDAIAVNGQYRGKGVGMGLTSTFNRALEEYGCRQCCLEVWQGNEAAIRLYEKIGFIRRAVFEDYYKKGQHAIVMCKSLANR